MIIMPSMGNSDTLALPDYVELVFEPDGSSYYKVPDEYAPAVAGALNSFQVTSRFPPSAEIGSLMAERVSGVGDLARVVSDGRRGRGIMLTGDVFSGDWVAVDFVERIQQVDGIYVLAAPDGGWPTAGGPSWTGAEIGPMATRAVSGIRWGAMIGGVVGLAVIATYAMRSR